MFVLRAYPPNYYSITARFPFAVERGVIFAWGDTIYNPSGGPITPALLAHERVHGERQGTDIEGWWNSYLTSSAFRLEEEIVAHRAEFRNFRRNHADRNQRAKYLRDCAARLASPLYGGLISAADAKKEITS